MENGIIDVESLAIDKNDNDNDSLIFLINEYFLNSSLASIEISSLNQDKAISNQMDALYQHTKSVESLKALIYDHQFNSTLNFSTCTFSQFNSKLNLSIGKENYYKRLFNGKGNMRNQKIIFKPLSNKRIEKIHPNKGVSLTEANQLPSKKLPNSIQNNKSNYQMNNSINYSRYRASSNKKDAASQRNSFKFEPKKQIVIDVMKKSDIKTKSLSINNNNTNHSSSQYFTPRNSSDMKNNQIISVSHSKGDQLKKRIVSESTMRTFLLNEKNEAILDRIMRFLSMKNNNLKGINWLLRRIYLKSLLHQTHRRLSILTISDSGSVSNAVERNNSNLDNNQKEKDQDKDKGNENNNDDIQIPQEPISSSNLDHKMEIEILKHIEAKISEFLCIKLHADKEK